MQAESSSAPLSLSCAVVVADAVLLNARLQESAVESWGVHLPAAMLAAGLVGGAARIVFARLHPILRTPSFTPVCAATLAWMAATIWGAWAFTDPTPALEFMFHWWFIPNPIPAGPYAFVLFTGDAVGGALAGLSLAYPLLRNPRISFRARLLATFGYTVVAGFVWMAAFHLPFPSCGAMSR